MREEPGAGEGTAGAAPSDLAQEFERIVEEKARLRLLSDQLGLNPAALRAAPSPAAAPPPAPEPPDPASGPAREAAPPTPAPQRERPHRRPGRRPSLPLAPETPPAAPAETALPARAGRSRAAILEALTGFVPAALYDELKRERDELFFRLTRLEMERAHVRRSLDTMEAEVRRLEEEVRRRRSADAPGAEPLRSAYRRWLGLRQRRAISFGDYLACRRPERGET